MNYWLSKRRIQTRVRVERYCASDKHSYFTLLRCPACREIYLAELEYEHIYQRRGLQKIGSRLSHFWENGCFKCGFIDTSNGCEKWHGMTREEVRLYPAFANYCEK